MRKTIVGLFAAGCLLMASLSGAAAQGQGPSVCKNEQPGQFVSFVAQEVGHSKENNPGNASIQPARVAFVPFVIGCNPTSSGPDF